jgi:hypothetical protein
MCRSKRSCVLQTEAMPPWAYQVFEACASRLETIATAPCAAALRAKESPAMPLPMTR